MPNLGDTLADIAKPLVSAKYSTGVLGDVISAVGNPAIGGKTALGSLGSLSGGLSSKASLTPLVGLQNRLNGALGKLGSKLPFDIGGNLRFSATRLGTFNKPKQPGTYSNAAGKGIEGNAISPYSGGQFMRPTLFKTIIGLPNKLPSIHDAQIISYACQSCTLPGRRFSTGDTRRGTPIMQKIPYDVLYPEVNMTFQVTKGMKERALFDAWQQLIYNPETNVFGYPDDYMVEVYIIQLDANTNEVRMYTLHEAYPVAVGEIQLAWDAFDQIETFSTSFNFKSWSAVTL